MPKNSAPLILDLTWEQAIEDVANERDKPDSKVSLFDLDFQKQTNVLEDPSKRKAIFCTRRGAKSYTDGLGLIDVCEKYHEVNTLFLALTKDHAMGIIWDDVLKKIDRKHSLEMTFIESKRKAISKTGSQIFISGADADAEEMQKLLGKKYKRIIIDEAQAFTVDLRTLVYGILGPTLVDLNGDIWLSGTAGNLTQGLFYDITNGKEPGWSLHKWDALDNPYVAKQWQDELDDIDLNRPKFKETTLFKQWYLNKWVIDEDAKVYKYDPSRNDAVALPEGLSGWHHVLIIDLAHSPDSSSFTVQAFHESCPTLYTRLSKKYLKMDITDVATEAKRLESIYGFDVKIVDGANKQAVAELNNRHGLNLIAADKTGKADFIKLMNDDYVQGKIKIILGAETQDLTEEYGKLIWVCDANGKVKEPRTEHPLIHNDCCDGALYGWRWCYQYLFQAPKDSENPHDQKVWEKKHIENLQEQVRQAQNPNELDLKWNEEWNDPDDL